MNCDQVQLILSEYLDNELDSDKSSNIRDHLAVCPECMRYLNQIQSLDSQLQLSLSEPDTARSTCGES